MQAALEQSAWDVVISDYSMPSFSGIAALRLLQQHGTDIPFIMLSGVVGEEIAVTAMKAGAHDFVTKGNLVRLVPAIERELREAALRREHKRMERALRISQDQFLSFMEYTPLVCWIADEDSRLRYANTGFARLLGTAPDSLTGKNLAELFPPQHAAVYLANNQRVLDTGEVLERMESVPRPAGDIGQFLTYRFPLQGIGKERLIGSVGLDITERLRAEEARARLAAIVESSNDAIISRSLDGTILSWNSGAEKLFGWTAQEAIGRDIRITMPAEDYGAMASLVERVLKGEATEPVDTRRLRKDGTFFHAQVSYSAVKDGTGSIVSLAVILRDISDRKRAEETLKALEHEQRLLAQLAESERARLAEAQVVAKIGSWETDLQSLNVTWSEETYRIFEVDPGRFVPTHAGFLEFVHAEDRAMVEAAFAASLEEQLPGTIEHRIVMADGRIKFVEERWHVFPGSVQGQVERAAGTCQDITERKLAEAKILDYAEQMRSLTQRLSEVEETERRNINRELHDRIGPNLVALKLSFHLAQSRLPPELQKTIGTQIEDAQKVLETTVAQLRNVMADLRPPALDDYGLLAALRTYAEPYSARLGIPVNVLGTDINPRLSLTAETTLFRIAQEALNNIAKHAQAKRVEITVRTTASHVILLVSDDGTGFDCGRPDRQRSSWGLRTMRERAQAIGAELRIESAPGSGARITVMVERGAA
jgi:PAS domain S-box-containing protein